MESLNHEEYPLSANFELVLELALKGEIIVLDNFSSSEINEMYDYFVSRNLAKENQIAEIRKKGLSKDLEPEQRKLIIKLLKERLIILQLLGKMDPHLIEKSAQLYISQIKTITYEIENLTILDEILQKQQSGPDQRHNKIEEIQTIRELLLHVT